MKKNGQGKKNPPHPVFSPLCRSVYAAPVVTSSLLLADWAHMYPFMIFSALFFSIHSDNLCTFESVYEHSLLAGDATFGKVFVNSVVLMPYSDKT